MKPTWDLGHPAQLQVVDVGGQREAVRPGEDGHAGAVLRVEDLRLQHVVLQHLLRHGERRRERGEPGLRHSGSAARCQRGTGALGAKLSQGGVSPAPCCTASSIPAATGLAPAPNRGLALPPAHVRREPAGASGSQLSPAGLRSPSKASQHLSAPQTQPCPPDGDEPPGPSRALHPPYSRCPC